MLFFRQVNDKDSPHRLNGFQKHHIIPLQILSEADLGSAFRSPLARRLLHDYRWNGCLLPATEAMALRTGLPLHRGPHPGYNRVITERLRTILGKRTDGLIGSETFFRIRLLQDTIRTGLTQASKRLFHLNNRDPLLRTFGFTALDMAMDRMPHLYAAQAN